MMGGTITTLFSCLKFHHSTDNFCISTKFSPTQNMVATLMCTKSTPINIPYKIPRVHRQKGRKRVCFRLSSSDSEDDGCPSSLSSVKCRRRVFFSQFRRFRVEAGREENHGKYKRLTSGLERSSEKYSNGTTIHEIPVNRISRKYETYCQDAGDYNVFIACESRKP